MIEKLCKKLKERVMKICNYGKKKMIPLTKEENKSYEEQETCHICEQKFCMDKNYEDYINKLKIFIRENLEELLMANAT